MGVTAPATRTNPAAEAALALFRAGGEFPDGALAHEGQWLGREPFLSLDKAAGTPLAARGRRGRRPG